MTNSKVIIVDDEITGRENILRLLNKNFPQLQQIKICSSIEDAVDSINQFKPDLVFMDIQLQTGTGFDVLSRVANLDFGLIFITAYSQYSLRAFKFSAIDYLLKPIDEEEFVFAVKRFLDSVGTKPKDDRITMLLDAIASGGKAMSRIALPTMKGLSFHELDEIVRCEADNNYTRFFFSNGNTEMVSRTLKEYEDMLTERGFCRIHKSHLINLKYVSKYIQGEGGAVVVKGGDEVPVSRRAKQHFMDLLNKTMGL